MKRTATKRGFHPRRHFCQRHFAAQAFAQIAETGLLYSNRLLDRVKPLLFACLLDKVPWESRLGKKNTFLWVRNNRNHQKPIESYDFCQLKPHLFSRRKELRGYPLIRRVGAISLCKFMTAPLALRTRGSVMGGTCYPGVE